MPELEEYEQQRQIALNKLEQLLKLQFEPCRNPTTADIHLSTHDLYVLLQEECPADYSKEDMTNILKRLGYTREDFGTMRYEWLLNKSFLP